MEDGGATGENHEDGVADPDDGGEFPNEKTVKA